MDTYDHEMLSRHGCEAEVAQIQAAWASCDARAAADAVSARTLDQTAIVGLLRTM